MVEILILVGSGTARRVVDPAFLTCAIAHDD